MTRLIVAAILAAFGTAFAGAADLPVKAPAMKVQPALYNWTGLYVGAHAGGTWGNKDWTFAPEGNNVGNHDLSHGLGGGQIGFNYQVANWVFGAEAQVSWAAADGAHVFAANPDVSFHSKVDWLGTVAGRIGYAWDRSLIFLKGGAAFAHDKFWITDGALTVGATLTETRWGWMLGGGFEYGLTPNWSAKIEYNYMDLGTATLNQTTVNIYDIKQYMNVLKVGINYRFGPSF